MNAKAISLTPLLVTVPALAQNEMHWYWHVRINGTLADQPINVAPGDEIELNLYAEMIPKQWAFAGSIFSLHVTQGDPAALFHDGSLNFDQADGYGRSKSLSALSPDNGTPFDADGDGVNDTLENIDLFQLPNFGPVDRSNPILTYSMLWTVGANPFDSITIDRVPTADGTYTNDVYIDSFGSSRLVNAINNPVTLNYIPTPASAIMIGLSPVVLFRRRR